MTEPILGTSHGKLNWWLKVGAVRPDGYHELETVFQELDLGEQVTITRIDDVVCMLTGFPPDIAADNNLVTRAWEKMKTAFPGQVSGVHFSVIKTLPHGGGIGGGSSNSAWAINAIDRLFHLNASYPALHTIAAELGSDVAFFLKGGTAVGRGRGEILEELAPCPRYWLVLMIPTVRMPTAQGYSMLDELRRTSHKTGSNAHTLSDFLTSLYSGDPEQLARYIHNDFELVAENQDWFRNCRSKLEDAGVLRAFLCGSGSTVAGLVRDKNTAQKISALVGGIPTSILV